MDLNPVVLAIPVYFLLIGIELIWATVKHNDVYRVSDAFTNISCGISSQVTGAIWSVISIGMYQYVYQYWSIASVPVNWWSSILLFFLVDLMYYWFHRASHEINFLWNVGHVVHHQSEDYNLSVALRQASFGGALSMIFYLPLAFLGFDAVAFLAVKGLNLIYQFWIHTEAIKKLPRWFEAIFNTPSQSHHRVHHGRNPKYIDKNHAGTLIIWDRIFGSFQKEEEKPTYGVTTPVNTWNPIRANIQPIVDMGAHILQTSGFINKIKVLFFKPGWNSRQMGGYKLAPALTGKEVKFNTSENDSLNFYLIAQYLFLLAMSTVFLLNQGKDDFPSEVKLISVAFIIWTVLDFGMLLEQRRAWKVVEIIRNILLPIIAYWFFPTFFMPLIIVSEIFALWFLFLTLKSNAN